uniref:F-box domain-containing protein n=1 Tax=Steinernema glaseri TaxID=37863 RepID=A0A1I7Y431_9BILA
MDAVPLKFVDSMIELFSKKTLNELAPEVCHPLWKDVLDLHHRNRVNYELAFRKTDLAIDYVFINEKEEEFFVDTRKIREKGRFARIVEVTDLTYEDAVYPFWPHAKELKDTEAGELFEAVAPLIDQVSGKFVAPWGSRSLITTLMTSLLDRVYLKEVSLRYCGQNSYDFLEDQIENSPFLSDVEIAGPNWPQSSLELLRKFCLRGRPGMNVTASVSSKDVLYYHINIKDTEGFEALIKKGEVKKICPGWLESFFKHETKKSIACLSTSYSMIRCYTCECDRFEKCHMKETFPEYHYLVSNIRTPILRDVSTNTNDLQPSATCHACSLTLPISQFFECSRCSSDFGLPEIVICGACALIKHLAHISEVRKARFLDAQGLDETLVKVEPQKQGLKLKEEEREGGGQTEAPERGHGESSHEVDLNNQH